MPRLDIRIEGDSLHPLAPFKVLSVMCHPRDRKAQNRMTALLEAQTRVGPASRPRIDEDEYWKHLNAALHSGGNISGALLLNFLQLWGNQRRPLLLACSAASIDPPINFHALRHTHASRLAMQGVPLAVIGAQLGHRDSRMVERHYGHMSPSYVSSTIRAAFGSLGIVEMDTVTPMTHTRQKA